MAILLHDERHLELYQASPSIHTPLTKEQFEFHPATSSPDREWTSLEPVIDQMTLNEDTATSRRTVLQRWQPGAVNQQDSFVHDYVEEIYLAEGDLYDLRLDKDWGKSAHAYRKPGMRHGPFKSVNGCLIFIVVLPAEGKLRKDTTG